MSAYREMKIDKSLYQRRGGFFRALEEMDPSADYRGTDLEKLTAFERQLKRFDIHVSGSASDPVEKFFRTSESAVLFPAYIGAAVEQGMQSRDILSPLWRQRPRSTRWTTAPSCPCPTPLTAPWPMWLRAASCLRPRSA